MRVIVALFWNVSRPLSRCFDREVYDWGYRGRAGLWKQQGCVSRSRIRAIRFGFGDLTRLPRLLCPSALNNVTPNTFENESRKQFMSKLPLACHVLATFRINTAKNASETRSKTACAASAACQTWAANDTLTTMNPEPISLEYVYVGGVEVTWRPEDVLNLVSMVIARMSVQFYLYGYALGSLHFPITFSFFSSSFAARIYLHS